MQEEVARFTTDLFQQDRYVLSLLDADHTFVNGALAAHYGLRVEGERIMLSRQFREVRGEKEDRR